MADDFLKLTSFDKWVANRFPTIGARRIKRKAQVNALMQSGAFEAARRGNRPFKNFTKFDTSPNSRVEFDDLAEMRRVSRMLVMNSIGGAINQRLTDHAIGNGLGFRAAVDADALKLTKERALEYNKKLTTVYNTFFFGQACHYQRMYTGGELQSTLFKSMLDGGDSVAAPVRVNRKNFPFPFALQLFEAELVNNKEGLTDTPYLKDGIALNANYVPVEVHISNKYPGVYELNDTRPSKWEALSIFSPGTDVKQVYQVKNLAQDRPGAFRGVPYIIPASGTILDLKTLNENILAASGIQAAFAVLLKGGSANNLAGAPDGAKESKTSTDFAKLDIKKGHLLDFRGTDDAGIEFVETKQNGKDFSPFFMDNVAIIGAVTGTPRSIILQLFGQNFSASRGEMALYWVTVQRFRYAFVFQFLQPFQEFLYLWAHLTGAINLPGFVEDPYLRRAWLGNPIHQWSGPRMVSIDPKKEAEGYKAQIDAEIKSRRSIIRTSSEDDADQIFDELEEERGRKLGQAIADQTKQIIENNESGEEDETDD